MNWPDGANYSGEWQFNQVTGKGKFSHPGGEFYDGQMINNKANGFGVYEN